MGELSNIPDDESSHLEKLRDALLDAPVDLALFSPTAWNSFDSTLKTTLTDNWCTTLLSGSLRRLFNEVNVTGQDDATRTFLEVRDSTRQQSIVYSKEILPKTEEAIKMISSYMDSYSDLDFDEWAECLNDTLEELKEAKDVCEVLRHMHNEIIIGMKKNEDKAVIGIEKLKNQYARQRQDLIKEARESKEKAQSTRFWGAVFGGLTLGISAAICEGVASGHDLESDRKAAEAVAKLQNAEIASKAVMLTSTELIPAIGNFIKSLEVCVSFINLSKTKVEKMISAGNRKNRKEKKKYYKMMKNRAKEISELCEMFVSVTDRMRINLAAIPENPDDKNYVDQWLEKQLEEFAQKEERDRSRFVKYFRSQTKAVKDN